METTALIVQTIFIGSAVLLAHAYLIYPLIALIIGAGRVQDTTEELPGVSILIPAYNEGRVIADKIENFLAIDYPHDQLELIVCNDGSSDRTAEEVQARVGDRVSLIESEGRGGKAAAMNLLAQQAKHPLLLFSDANVMLAPNAVRFLVDVASAKTVGAVTGEVRLEGSDQEFRVGEALYYWMERRIQGAESRLGSVMGVDGGMYLIRHEYYEPIPPDTILDDFLISMNVMRAGRRVIYEAAAKATESGTPSAKQEIGRRVRIAAGAVQLLKRGNVPKWNQPIVWLQFISHKILRWISPFLLILAFVSNAILIFESDLFLATFVIQVVGYLALLITWLIPPTRRALLGSIGFYFLISQIAILIGTYRGLLNKQPSQWDKETR